MSQANRKGLPSLLVKGLGLLALLAIVWMAGVAQVQASECFLGENIIIIYWSSAAHTTIVGECSTGPCPGAGCTGTKSSFITSRNSGICEVCVE